MSEFLTPPNNSIIPELIFIEVEPLVGCGNLCPIMIKLKLRELCVVIHVDKETAALASHLTTFICSGLLEIRNSNENHNNKNAPFIFRGRGSGNPDCANLSNSDLISCQIRGFYITPHTSSSTTRSCVITDSTFVRVLLSDGNSKETLLSDSNRHLRDEASSTCSSLWDSFVLSCHDKSMVDLLAMQMSIRLRKKYSVATTSDAIQIENCNKRRVERCSSFANRFFVKHGSKETSTNLVTNGVFTPFSSGKITSLVDEGILCVFDEVHGSGKTELVKAVAFEKLKCCQVHVVTAGVLFAKYGELRADFGLQNLLHAIILSAAVRGENVCIILDRLADFLPSHHKNDNLSPCLHAIAGYLSYLSGILNNGGVIPFPKDPLYALGTNGFCLPVQMCVVGVLTLGSPASNSKQIALNVINNCLVGSGRLLLKPPSGYTRIAAFQKAFQMMEVNLDENSKNRLPQLAFAAIAARGASFLQTARQLSILQRKKKRQYVTLIELQKAFAPLLLERSEGQEVFFSVASENKSPRLAENGSRLFENVGGNKAAKLALEDALALNEVMQRRLGRFGVCPPSGILFFGSPGTGKTLLARATAEYLLPGDGGIIGGAFLSLKASEVVRAEIGTSEQIVVNTFETARSNSPSVIFIDEFEALFSDRDKANGSSRLASTLMQCMDDVTKWRNTNAAASTSISTSSFGPDGADELLPVERSARVIVLGATNMPWMIDNAFLRPGRFDRVIHVGLPSLEERQSIFLVHLRRMKLQYEEDGICDVESMSAFLAARCDSFSGADIEALCRAAAVRCLRRKNGAISVPDFVMAREKDVTKPSCDSEMVLRLLKWKP